MNSLRLFVVVIAGVLICSCGGSGGGTDPLPVSGQINLPEETDKDFQVFLDTDVSPANGYVRVFTDNCKCGTSPDYYFENAPAGTYYVYAIVRNVSALDADPQSGDYLGFYGGGASPTCTANVSVTSSGVLVLDIPLSLYTGQDLMANCIQN